MLGKLSGRHALRGAARALGYRLDDEDLKRAFVRFKELADRKREVTDRDLEAIVADERQVAAESFHLEHLQVSCGTNLRPTATVRMLLPSGESRETVALGDGPIDATYRAIDALVQVEGDLDEFAVQAITAGMDAVGEVTVRLRHDGALSAGRGADTDIIVAAAKAYVQALNRVAASRESRPAPDPGTHGRPEGRDGGHQVTEGARTLFDKIWDSHVVVEEESSPALIYVDLHLVHEVTSPQAFEGLRLEGRKVRRPAQVVATMDHNVPTTKDVLGGADQISRTQMETLRRNCDEAGITCTASGTGGRASCTSSGPSWASRCPAP